MKGTVFSVDTETRFPTTENWNDTAEFNSIFDINAFRLVNFKAFRDTGWIKLNRLTLLLGDNSSGKSALYQAIQMVSFAYEKMMREEIFTNLYEVSDQIGKFDDICNKSAKEDFFEVDFQFLHQGNVLEYCVRIARNENDEYGKIVNVTGKKEKNCWDFLQYYESVNIFFLKRKENTKVPGEIEEAAGCFLASLRQFAQSLQIITAHRYRPERFMQLTGTEPANVGKSGMNTYDMLYALTKKKEKQSLLVKSWLNKFGYSYRWEMAGFNRGEFILHDIKTGIESNLVDNGFGISQSLPLALALETLEKGGTLLVDSPEAFLQTRMQSEMGDLLIEGSQNGNVLVETGSEYLTIRIRRRVAEGIISKEEVSFYFLEETDDGKTLCVPVELNENGDFINTSTKFEQFFSSDFWDIEKLDQVRRERYAKENCNRYQYLGKGDNR